MVLAATKPIAAWWKHPLRMTFGSGAASLRAFRDDQLNLMLAAATESPVGRITLCTRAEVDRAVEAAQRALVSFSHSSRQERLDLLSSILGVYVKRQDELAEAALTDELGAPRKFAKEVQVGAGLWHLQTAMGILNDYKSEYPQSSRSVIRRQPIGVVGAITPGNWPVNQVVIKVFPAFATGCTVVHKPFGGGSAHCPCAGRDLS